MCSQDSSSQDTIDLSISFKGQTTSRAFPSDLTFHDLQEIIFDESNIPPESQKLLAPKLGLIKIASLAQGSDTPLATVFAIPQSRKRIILMGTPLDKLGETQTAEKRHFEQQRRRSLRYQKYRERQMRGRYRGLGGASSSGSDVGGSPSSRPDDDINIDNGFNTPSSPFSSLNLPLSDSSRNGPFPGSSEERDADAPNTQYTFHRLVPLPFLHNSEKSRSVLQSLREDRGIRAIMEKYQWSVPVLTELDPASNTRSDGGGAGGTTRLLGLNRNRGQVIELRLRTDAYDGWLKYKDVRKVLCHELAHNVHGPHDEKFWALFHKLEREVVDLDPFGKRGRTIFAGERYEGPMLKVPGDDSESDNVDERDFFGLGMEEIYDSGGWIGGTYVLGTGDDDGTGSSSTARRQSGAADDMKSVLRQAAFDREQRRKERSSTPPMIPPPKVAKTLTAAGLLDQQQREQQQEKDQELAQKQSKQPAVPQEQPQQSAVAANTGVARETSASSTSSSSSPPPAPSSSSAGKQSP